MDGKHEMRCLSVLTLGEVLCGIGWSWLLQQDPLFVDLSYTEKCKVSAVVPSCDTGSTSLSFVDDYKTPAIVTHFCCQLSPCQAQPNIIIIITRSSRMLEQIATSLLRCHTAHHQANPMSLQETHKKAWAGCGP